MLMPNGSNLPPQYVLIGYVEPHLCVLCGTLNVKCVCNTIHPAITRRRYNLIKQMAGTVSDN